MAFGWVYCHCSHCVGSMRIMIITFAILTIILGYTQGALLHIALVEMVEQDLHIATCPNAYEQPVLNNITGGKINWSRTEQGLSIYAYFIGCFITQVPFGIGCDKIGPRYPLLIGMILSSGATMLIPVAVLSEHWWLVCILRLLTGFGQGAIYPGVASLITRWIPLLQRSETTALIFASNSIGMILGHVCTRIAINWWQTWTYAFYLWGGIGLIYCINFFLYVFSDPSTHPGAYKCEIDFLHQTMIVRTKQKIPFKQIFRDRCVYALIFMEMGHDMLLFTLGNNYAKFMNHIFNLNITESHHVGFLFFLLWGAGVFSGILADCLIKKQNISMTLLRKAFTVISNFGTYVGICFGVISKCSIAYAVTCFALAIFFKGIYYGGGFVNIIDISVNHPGFIMSLIIELGAILGAVMSIAMGIIAKNMAFHEWEVLLGLIGLVEVTLLVLYILLSTSKRRDWDYADGEEPERRPIRKRWFNELSESDYRLRLENERQAHETMKESARASRERMR